MEYSLRLCVSALKSFGISAFEVRLLLRLHAGQVVGDPFSRFASATCNLSLRRHDSRLQNLLPIGLAQNYAAHHQ
jgi:hypothetical protein